MTDQYLTFLLRGEQYAVPVVRVKEILDYETITRVPGVPAHIRGVIKLRGTVVPVIDLSAKFGHGESERGATTCIVVVEMRIGDETVAAGLLVDAVSQVLDIPSGQIAPPPAFGTNVHIDFLAGIGKLESCLALVLDLDRILSPVETLEAVEAAVEAEAQAVNP